MTGWTTAVRRKLERLGSLDPGRARFGAGKHGYAFHPPATEEELGRFEREMRVRLPAEYRTFLAEVGNGGAGPHYGLEPPAPWPSGPADPAEPFLLDAAWAPVDAEGNSRPLPVPQGKSLFDGCLFLSDIGCGYCCFLVVTGERAGEVWVDYTAGDGEIAPTGLGFRGWYEEWLDAELRGVTHGAILAELEARTSPPRADLLEQADLFEARASARPDDPIALLALAHLRLYQGRRDESRALADRIERAQPDLPALDRLRYLVCRDRADEAASATAPERLAELAGDGDEIVRRAVAANPATPAQALVSLARDPDARVAMTMARNPAATFDALAALVDRASRDADSHAEGGDGRTSVFILDLVARHEGAGPLLERILGAAEREGLAALAWPVALHPEAAPLLPRLASDPRPWARHGVACNPATPAELLDLLAGDDDVTVREGVAGHESTRPATLARLAGDAASRVRAAAAANAETPHRALIALLLGEPHEVRYALGRNAGLSPELVDCLAHHPDTIVRAGMARRASLPGSAARRLASDPDASVRSSIAWSPALPADVVQALLRDPQENVRAAALANPHLDPAWLEGEPAPIALDRARAWSPATDPAELERLALHPDPHLRSAVASNPSVPRAVLARILLDPMPFVASTARAHLPRIPGEPLVDLARDRRSAAGRPAFPVAWLAEAARHDDVLVAMAAAYHPWTPPAVLEELARHGYGYTRLWVARHPAVTLEVLDALRADEQAMVRAAAVASPLAPAAWLPALARDEEDEVREAVAMRPDAPAEILAVLARDPAPYVRRGVARNPAAPPELLAAIARDEDANVRTWALDHPHLPRRAAEAAADDADARVRLCAVYWLAVDALRLSLS